MAKTVKELAKKTTRIKLSGLSFMITATASGKASCWINYEQIDVMSVVINWGEDYIEWVQLVDDEG